MEHFAWPLAAVVIAFAVLIGYRKSLSRMLQSIRPHKVLGAEFDPVSQLEIEEAQINARLAPTNSAQDDAETTDPVLVPIIRSVREDLDNRSNDPAEREKLLIHAVAVWQVNHENARIARYIFGSQLNILLHLNSRPDGETLENIRTFYDTAAQNFPATFRTYSFESYLAFLERSQLLSRQDQRVFITPKAKALFHYMIATGDSAPRPN